MKSSTFFPIAVALLVSAIQALILEERDAPAVFKLSLQKRTNEVNAQRLRSRLMRRLGEVEVTDTNYQRTLLYILPLYIGTPPQSVMVRLDTGSSDLVVETDSSNICSQTPPNPCTNFGAYDANSSSTYQYLNSDLVIQYGSGDGATGDYGLDIVTIGGATIQNFQLGIMYKTTVLEGIVGVSFTESEFQTQDGKPPYDNLPVLLVKQGYIASRAFSLWTNDDRSASGTLLFGGVDTAKYYGNLVTVDLVPSGSGGSTAVVDFTIVLNSVAGTDGSGNPAIFSGGSTATNVLMDSGTTLTDLPDALVSSIWTFAGATANPSSPSSASIPCSAGSSTATINLHFTGITISVPLSQLVIFPDGSGTCEFGITKAGSGTVIIGDTVLSSMYVVYDLDNKQLSLAPTVFNATTSNIVQIMAGPGGVPNDPGVGGAPSTTTSSSSTSTTSSSSTTTTSSSSTSTTSSSSTTTTSSSSTTTTSSSSTSTTSSSSTTTTSSSSTSTTSSSSTSTTSSTSRSTTSTTMMRCNGDNCLRGLQHASAASAFCSTYKAGVGTLPTYVSGCSSSTARISSACTCLLATTPSTTTTGPTSTKAAPCYQDNCLRAIEDAAAKSFCSMVLTGGIVATPTAIAKGCATLSSRVSSGCTCYTATAV